MFNLEIFFPPPSTTPIYALSLHDALPISRVRRPPRSRSPARSSSTRYRTHGSNRRRVELDVDSTHAFDTERSEEHTSELQSPYDLVCRLLLEKKIARTRRNGERRRAPTASISKESPAITGVVEMVIRRPICTARKPRCERSCGIRSAPV